MILVTGGAGFIGGNFLHYINKFNQTNNYQIACLDKLTYASNYDRIKPLIEDGFVDFYQQSINSKLLKEILQSMQPKYILNFAAETHVDNSIADCQPFIETNVLGTINLLEACKDLKSLKKFIHVSTDEVYGSLHQFEWPFTEMSPYEPNSPYSASKASSDHWVRAYHKTYGVPTIITNCSNNYGPAQHTEKFIPKIINNALKDEKIPVYGNGLNVRDWLYVEDHCRALYQVMTSGVVGEKYNIGGGVEIANITMVKKILQILGKPESLIEHVTDRAGHDFRYAINFNKIKQELGYQPIYNLDRGLEKTIEWSLNGIA